MNIWVIGRSYPLMINNMQGLFELEQAKMLEKHGNEVAYLACVFHPFKKVKKWGFTSWKEKSLKVFCNSQFFVHERMKLHLELFKASVWKSFLDKVEKETGCPDVIHIHYPANITVAKIILEYRKRGTKIICTEHWSQVLKQVIDSYERKQLKSYADFADAFLCVGWPLKDSVIDMTKTKRELHVVPNMVNPLFKPTEKTHAGFRFVAVGVLVPCKQFDRIIDAFSDTFKDKKKVSLTIVGGGVEMKHLKELVQKYNLEDQITLTGELKRDKTAEIVKNSDVLICYSSYETFGVPLIEAMACGIPVISSTAASIMEKWDVRLGIETDPSAIQTLKDAMVHIHDNYSKYNHEFIKDFAMRHYSESAVYNLLMDYYR